MTDLFPANTSGVGCPSSGWRSARPADAARARGAGAKHINSIFTKLDLPKADADHGRGVLTVRRLLGVANAALRCDRRGSRVSVRQPS
ncbi:hypothetical protein [Streptomyces sp. NBC_00576]|uniref:hypothetical protein n=1 Tax=Streptomyces sp. NBC_00576 TaxID=2903665 RepID=UPI003FCCA26C